MQSFPGGSVVKNLPANAGDEGLISGSGRFPWKRKWHPAPVFLPGKSHGQWSLAGYSPWGHKKVRQDLATKQKQQPQCSAHGAFTDECVAHGAFTDVCVAGKNLSRSPGILPAGSNKALLCLLLWAHTINKDFFHSLCSVTSFTFLCFFLVILLFKMTPALTANVLCSVPKCKKAAVRLTEKIQALEKRCSGTTFSAVVQC